MSAVEEGADRPAIPEVADIMKYGSPGFLLLAMSTIVAVIDAPPAQAEFYRLDGRFECLERQGAVCYDATVAASPREPAHDIGAAAPEQKTVSQEKTPAAGPDDLREILALVETRPPAAPVDRMQPIAARIAAKTPTPGDFATLEADAKAGDLRAVELLAWCAYTGIGGKPDPIRAYFLYGQAAAAGIAAMARNQATVYATMLTSEQRQQIAEIENSQ